MLIVLFSVIYTPIINSVAIMCIHTHNKATLGGNLRIDIIIIHLQPRTKRNCQQLVNSEMYKNS